MAWTTLNTNNLLAGEPLVEQETLAFYENPIAIADGAAGAPRIQAAGIGTGQVPLNKFSQISAGNSRRVRSDAALEVVRGTNPAKVLSFPVVQSGSIRLRTEHRRIDANSRVYFRRLRNGSLSTIATFDTGSTTYTAVSADISCIPGDVLSIWQSTTSGTNTVGTRNRWGLVGDGQSFIPIDDQGHYEGNP
jgi:hypothetical protein